MLDFIFAPSWKSIAQQKQSARDETIAKTLKQLESGDTSRSSDDKYLHATASEIVGRIGSGEWTSKEVVTAYILQAIKAHKATNCLTEILFNDAIKEAAELDAEFASTKRLRGSLHGVPVSFKDQYEIAGYDATIGFTQWANKPCASDAALVKQFRAAGAIVIAKTNVPQTMLSFECSNPLFGRTTNPWSAAHTCGGSSGGEAALLAMNGSALGVGSDIGGSLRIPAAYCGLYSIKPGQGRVSKSGSRSANAGFEAVISVMGPMARSVEDIELVSRLIFGGPAPAHENLAPLPYREVKLPKKLRFGYYTSDLFIKASPACQRAVLETVDALRKLGHECIEFEPILAKEAVYLFIALTSSDGYKNLLSHLGPDPKESSLFLVTLAPKFPAFLRNFVSWAVKTIIGDEIFSTCTDNSRVKSTSEFYTKVAERDRLRAMWYEEVWEKYEFDGILAPVQATPAVPHGATTTLSPLAAGTFAFNVIDSPVGIVPVTRVDPAIDRITHEWTKGPGHGSTIFEDGVYRSRNAPYNPDAMKGLPVGVQIIGKTFEEENVIEMMKIVDNALGPRDFGPTAWPPRRL